jgi:hypothetical protein
LRVRECQGPQATKYYWVVCDDYRVLVFDCLVGDCFGEIDGEEDGVFVAAARVEWRFQEQTGVVEGLVGESLWIESPHGRDDSLGERGRHGASR